MKLNNKKGVALLVALSIAIVLVILATAMLMLVRGHYGTTANQIQHTKAYYLAEAGVQYALARCRVGNFSNFSFSEDGKTVNVTLSYRFAPYNDYQIQSQVTY
jgi:type II secretory pathway component PulK